MSKKLQFLPVAYINKTLKRNYQTADEIPKEDWIRALGTVMLAAAALDASEFRDPAARLERLAREYDYLEIVEEEVQCHTYG